MPVLFEKYQEVTKAANNDLYSTISVRSPIELASMIETTQAITQESVINMFTSDLSDYLGTYLVKDKRNIELITQILEEEYQKHGNQLLDMIKESCIESLINSGYLEMKNSFELLDVM